MSKEKLSKEQKKAMKADKKAEKKAKGGNPDVSAALIQCISALLCVGIIAMGASTITNKVNENKLEIAGKTGTSSSQSAGTADVAGDTSSDDVAADDTVADVADDTAADDVVADDTSADVADSSTDGSTSSSDSSASAIKPATIKTDSGKKDAGKKSLSTADILNIYNSATKKAVDKKVGFSKTRTTVEKKYEAGLALKSFKSIVYKFMGVGDGNKFTKTVTSADADSYHKYFLASSLSAADIAGIKCDDKGNSYTITVALKDGASAVTNGKVTQNSKTALDKSGVSCGEKDKDYWDHKTAENIYSAISEVPGCSSASIKERYSGAVITMDVTKDGKITSYTAKYSFHVDIDGVMGSSGVAEAASTVVMNNFKW
ncbi:MAG: hypothetical protein MJ147_00540 [Clostridia bacterium]|nr:hypothetical protein [Clostridia bacterium]